MGSFVDMTFHLAIAGGLARWGRVRRFAVLPGVCLALSACTVGPDYQAPAAPEVADYTATPTAAVVPAAKGFTGPGSGAQHWVRGAPVDPHWWKGFGSPALDRLVDQALAHNPDLAAAQATLETARYNLKAAQAVFYPQLSLGLSSARTQTSAAAPSGPQLYTLQTGQVSVGYLPDVFGLNRLVTRGQQALVDVADAQLQAARLTIAAQVASAVLNLAALDEALAVAGDTAREQQQMLDLTETRYRLGATSQFDVFTQQSQLASTRAQLAQLQQARDSALHLLAGYLGQFPAQAGHLDLPALAALQLPAQLPLTLPSALVRDRPDIRAAEAQLRAANAQVGVAVARMYPSIQLTADWGGQSEHWGSLLNPAQRAWDLAAGLVMPIFEGGALRAQKHAAEAAYRGVFAQYRSAVLTGFRNVADTLKALQHDAAVLDEEARATRAAQQALDLVRTQYQSGQVDFLNVLTSETQVQTARLSLIQAQAQRYADTIALYVALGGGTWPDAADATDTPRALPEQTATPTQERG